MALAIAAGATAAAAGGPPCGPERAETVKATRDARIWMGGRRSQDTREVFACRRGRPSRSLGESHFSFGPDEGYHGVDATWLNDRHVAWTEYGEDQRDATEETTLQAMDLRTGARRDLAVHADAERITDVVLRRGGAIAWIQRADGELQVRRRLRTKIVTLDHGTVIGRRSLRGHGDRVHWRHGDRVRSAYLPR